MTEPSGMFAPLPPTPGLNGRADPPAETSLKWVAAIPEDAPEAPPLRGSQRWWYHDATGGRSFAVDRYEARGADDRKKFMPVTLWETGAGEYEWLKKHPPVQRPLYGLPQLAQRQDERVLVLEGEKSADAAAKLFPDLVAVTSSGGGKAEKRTEWGPIAGRMVLIWPDNDDTGRDYASGVAKLAHDAGAASVRIVNVPDDWPAGWDLADTLPAGVTAEMLRELIDAAAASRQPLPPIDCNGRCPMSDPPITNPAKGSLDGHSNTQEQIASLLKATTVDPSAAFTPGHIVFLVSLRRADKAAFESTRAKLKSFQVRVAELDKAMRDASGESGSRGPAQADKLIEFAEECELFHAPDGTAFADIEIDGHRETMPVRHKTFKRWLNRRYYAEHDGAPNSEAVQSALGVFEARAHFEGPERKVFVRVGSYLGKVYIDLGDKTWRAIDVDVDGWRVVERPPVRFRRSAGLRPLALPTRGGKISDLRPFLNVGTDDEFVLVVSWLLATMRPDGPYPIMALSGEQGSAKSTFTAILRALIDPNTAPLRALPREDRDLFIAANNGHLLAFDNISGLPPWISDTLCRLATGGGFAVRALYSDEDEKLFDACRPVILNGIEDGMTRADLADRAIAITLRAIPEEARRAEREVWEAFYAAHPAIFGALLDAVSVGLRKLPATSLDSLPRMADFALWATACETAHSDPGAFMRAYGTNRSATVDAVLEADPVAGAIMVLMEERREWSGSASELLTAVNARVSDEQRKARTWPSAAHVLSGRVRRAATFLRRAGLDVAFPNRSGSARRITITRMAATDDDTVTPEAPIPSGRPDKKRGQWEAGSEYAISAGPNNRGGERHRRHQASQASLPSDAYDDALIRRRDRSVTCKALIHLKNDAVTLGDAPLPHQSGGIVASDLGELF